MSDRQPSIAELAQTDLLIQQWIEDPQHCEGTEELFHLITTYPSLTERTLGEVRINQWLNDLASEAMPTKFSHFSSGVERPNFPTVDEYADLLQKSARSRWLSGRIGIGVAALLVALVVIMSFPLLRPLVVSSFSVNSDSPLEPLAPVTVDDREDSEPMTNEVAIVSRSVGAKTHDGSPALRVGKLLSPGLISLEQGIVRIDFFNGASIVLEGDCELEILSQNHVFCGKGKLNAVVSEEASGFLVDSPHGAVLDLGTEFGVSVTPDQTDVHVFEGIVELPASNHRQLKSDEGGRMSRGKLLETFPADQVLFTTIDQVDELQAAMIARRYAAWKNDVETLNQDRDLLLRLDFSNLSGNTSPILSNQAKYAVVRSGVLIGCQSTTGRWPGEQALCFRNLSDRVRLDLPGKFDAVTVTTWVCLHSLPGHFAGLMMTDDLKPGNFHWQLTRKGELLLCVGNGRHLKSEVTSPAFLTPDLLGQWLHLGLVINSTLQEATFYLNGEILWQGALSLDYPIQMGPTSLGNWSNATAPHNNPIRNLCGDMGELTIHMRALAPQELRQLYISGEPDLP